MVKISASLLSARDNLKYTLEEFNKLDIDYIHLDIMDGKFVSNSSFTEEEIDYIINNTNKKIDVHLMVENPEEYIAKYNTNNVEYITIHYEALKTMDIIDKIKSINKKVGVSIKPNTDVKDILNILNKIDLVLVMSVEPGMGGQKFIEKTLFKINLLNNIIDNNNYIIEISVDGGINENNAQHCVEKGSDILVIGSSLVYTIDKNKYVNILKGIDLN